MTNRKGQIPPQIIPIAVAFLVIVLLLPVLQETFNSISCQREKGTISNLESELNKCREHLNSEKQKLANAVVGLDDCQKRLAYCGDQLNNCTQGYSKLQDICDEEEMISEYYFIKVFSNKVILFEWLILYHIHLFALFFTFGITLTIKLFQIDVHIELLNEKHQKEFIRFVKQSLAEHPYVLIIVMLIFILITNIPQLINLFL
jgi:hypothetical protein